jgi:hypothetical protein
MLPHRNNEGRSRGPAPKFDAAARLARVPLRTWAIGVIVMVAACFLRVFAHPLIRPGEQASIFGHAALPNLIHKWKLTKVADGNRLAVTTKPREDSASPCVTFVVHSSGWRLLSRALESVRIQTNGCWAVIVVITEISRPAGTTAPIGDSSEKRPVEVLSNAPPLYTQLPMDQIEDSRITFLSVQGFNKVNDVRSSRNRAFNYVRGSWVAFLNEYDTISPGFVQALLDEEKLTPDASLLLFRMHCSECFAPVLPEPTASDFKNSFITSSLRPNRPFLSSFAVKLVVLKHTGNPDGVAFNPGCAQDYELLHTIRKKQEKIVITPHLAYFVDGVLPITVPEMQRTVVQWDDSRAQSAEQDVDQERECARERAAADVNIARGRPKFLFPNLHRYYEGTLNGIVDSIHTAAQMGCLDNWEHGAMDIDIDISWHPRSVSASQFTGPRWTTADRKAPFIQIQMEDMEEDDNVAEGDTRPSRFTHQYVDKLGSAVQLWEFSAERLSLYRQLGVQNRALFYMPQWLMLAPRKQCASASGRTHAPLKIPRSILQHSVSPACTFKAVPAIHNGFMGDTERKLTEGTCLLVGGDGCSDEDKLLWGQILGMPVCPQPEILLFIDLADYDRVGTRCRLVGKLAATCRTIAAANKERSVGCFELWDVRGSDGLKEELICAAGVIFIESFFEDAPLQVNRINSLLAAGKTLVVVSSNDKTGQAEYADVVTFAPSSGDLAQTIGTALSEGKVLASAEQKAVKFASDRKSELTPLCYALQDLNGAIAKMKAAGTLQHHKTCTAPSCFPTTRAPS